MAPAPLDTSRTRSPGWSGLDCAELQSVLFDCAAGSESAFADLYARTHRQVHTVALRILHSIDHAVEIVQETYLEVWLKAGLYDPRRGSVVAWITMIAHRRAIDRIRSVEASRLRDNRDAELREAVGTADLTDAIAARLDTRGVHGALAGLSPIQRQALQLRYFEDCTLQQMADRLVLPLGTVKTRVRDALIRLRENVVFGPDLPL